MTKAHVWTVASGVVRRTSMATNRNDGTVITRHQSMAPSSAVGGYGDAGTAAHEWEGIRWADGWARAVSCRHYGARCADARPEGPPWTDGCGTDRPSSIAACVPGP